MSENIHFEKLTPTNDYNLGIYKNAMDFIFAEGNEDISNIAITGPYASGKSSMIETYEKKYTNKKFIHISLAHFQKQYNNEEVDVQQEEIEDDEVDSSKSDQIKENNNYTLEEENRLEGKIINQLIHKIDSEKIPQTNFIIKKKIELKDIILKTAVYSVFVILILYIMFFEFWYTTISNMNPSILKSAFEITLNTEGLIFSGLVCLAIVVFWIFKGIENQRFTKSFKKFNIQGNEIEIFEDNDESYFDKYLNEVLYIIKNAEMDAFVFEDIDRYNSGIIFEKLREINILVNSRYKEEKNIKFIYLLKDDMFTSKDRTKFFDYIIPIVPVIDSSNSYDKFIEQFKKGNLFTVIKGDFFKDISLYVDDMRLLKNIYNEFQLYYTRLEKDNLDASKNEKVDLNNNKLLGIIIYKNIFPKDFSDLQLGKGFVYCILNSKEEIISKEIERINQQIKELQEEKKDTEQEKLNSIDELDACFFTYRNKIKVNSKEEEEFHNRIELIKELKKKEYKCQQFEYNYSYQSYQWNNCDLSTIFNEIQNTEEYKKRKIIIENKINNKVEDIIAQIHVLEAKRDNLKGKYIQDLIKRENIEEVFKATYKNELGEEYKFEEIKRSIYFPLIKYLIRNGYIDENYPDYMTYFYPNSLNYSDKEFLLSIANKKKKGSLYELINCKLIMSRLKLVDFLEEEIMNCYLLCYLLKEVDKSEKVQEESKYKKHLSNFLKNIEVNGRSNFVNDFMRNMDEVSKQLFVKAFNSHWDKACMWISWNEEYDDLNQEIDKNIIREYMQKTIMYSPYDDIVRNNEAISMEYMNQDGSYCISIVTYYINQDEEFLNMEPVEIDEVVSVLINIGVKMNYINYDKCNKELFKQVYKNNLYDINYSMISLILEKVYEIPRSNDYKEKNYSLIMSHENEPLAQYINNKISDYFEVILDEKPTDIIDELEYVLLILNNDDLEDYKKEQYIKLLNTKIILLKEVNNKELWPLLIDNEILEYKDENLLDYYFEKDKSLDKSLEKYINTFNSKFEFDSNNINSIYGEDGDSNLFESIVNCNQINDEKYKELLERFNKYYPKFNIKSIEYNKINILIDLKIIRMSAETLDFMRHNYHDNILYYIINNIDEYVNVCKDSFIYEEMLNVIDEDIKEDKKIELVDLSDDAISIKNKNYSSSLKEYILKNKFNHDDIEYIIRIYSNEDSKVKEIIREIVTDNINEVINEKYTLGYDLLTDLLNSTEIVDVNKKKLISMSMKYLRDEEVYRCFELLESHEFKGLFNSENLEVAVDSINEELLEGLKEKRIINSYELFDDEDEGVQCFTVNGRK